jgi:outer membrane lipoprotein-sorting protein
MTYLKIFLISLLTLKHGYADDLLTQIASGLTKADIAQGEFQQEKKLKFLNKPLSSQGAFTYDKVNGIIWKTLTPIQSVLLINDTQVSAGQDKQDIPPAFGSVFKALLSGDINRLSENFELANSGKKSAWQLVLKPKDELLKKMIDNIRLSGDSEVRQWELTETSGNLTRITFTQITHPSRLSNEQIADFGQLSP